MHRNFLVGPLSPNGSAGRDLISYRHDKDNITNGQKLFHENDVNHFKAEGEFTFVPLAQEVSALTSSYYPFGCSWSALIGDSSSQTTVVAENGIGTGSTYARIDYSDKRPNHFAVVNGDPYDFEVIMVYTDYTYNKPSSALCDLHRFRYVFEKKVGSTMYFKYSKIERSYQPNKYLTSWAELNNNPTLIKQMWAEGTKEVVRNLLTPGFTATCYRSSKPISFSVQNFKTYVDSLIGEPGEILVPLKPVHFGELAMQAVEKVNRNPVNMIAFLKDLRKPWELIPKLKNLKKLRTHAGNYLGMEYGILPTIGDLKLIFEALKARQPYLDRHGWSTYTASVHQSSSDGFLAFELDQRIKIAVEDEDSDFRALAHKIDSAGFALTLENVWDLIPYSFVVDWFIGIGDFLERCDTRMRIMKLDIPYVTMSQKVIVTQPIVPDRLHPYGGTLKKVQYSRWTVDHCPEPPLFFQNTPTVSDHWLEASALFLSRNKY